MVAHTLTDTPAFPAVMARRRPLFQENPLTRFLTLVLYIMPSDTVEVEPCFVVAMKPYLPLSVGFRRFNKPTHVSTVARDRSGSPQWCGAWRHRQSAVSKGLLNDAKIVAVVASPRSTIEVTSNQVHIHVPCFIFVCFACVFFFPLYFLGLFLI